jgi:hypothetical protein
MSTPVPVVNVNLQHCEYPELHATGAFHTCRGGEVLIPCPIRRSVKFMVRLGECACGTTTLLYGLPHHAPDCPARPVRVSCSIGGDDWASSRVTFAMPDGTFDEADLPPPQAFLGACAARWAVVKALVFGMPRSEALDADVGDKVLALFTQRDAAFSALAMAHRAEDALIVALGDYEEAMRGEPVGIHGLNRESTGALERYVARLIEQVGQL